MRPAVLGAIGLGFKVSGYEGIAGEFPKSESPSCPAKKNSETLVKRPGGLVIYSLHNLLHAPYLRVRIPVYLGSSPAH